MDSKKRFTETHKWELSWFMELEPEEKLLWSFINDRCDNIGVWEPNMRLAEFHIGSNIDVDVFFDKVNEGKTKNRLIELKNQNWLIADFCQFQYGKLNPNNRAHKSYLDLMRERNLFNWFLKHYPDMMQSVRDSREDSEGSYRGLKEPKEEHKEKEQEKDPDREKGKDTDKEEKQDKTSPPSYEVTSKNGEANGDSADDMLEDTYDGDVPDDLPF